MENLRPPVGILTMRESTAALFPTQGSSAMGLGRDFFRRFLLWCWLLSVVSGILSSSVSTCTGRVRPAVPLPAPLHLSEGPARHLLHLNVEPLSSAIPAVRMVINVNMLYSPTYLSYFCLIFHRMAAISRRARKHLSHCEDGEGEKSDKMTVRGLIIVAPTWTHQLLTSRM